jgi:hypothetical protein
MRKPGGVFVQREVGEDVARRATEQHVSAGIGAPRNGDAPGFSTPA